LLRSITIFKKKEMTFKSNNEIFLSVKNIRVRKFCKKLTNYYLNFFRISEKINNNVYKLKLSNQYGKLNVRKLPDIHRELPRHVNRASYPGEMLRIPPWKHYIGSPLLPSELDIWRLGADIAETLAKLFRFGNYISEKKRKFNERRILNSFFPRELRKVSVQSPLSGHN
jgi:hypothetical protein